MGALRPLATAAALVAGAACAQAQPVDVLGDWRVVDAACVGCADRGRDELGRTIAFGPSATVDPFGGGCPSRIGASELTPTSIDKIRTTRPIRPAWLPERRRGAKLPFGFLTCNAMDYAEVVIVSRDRMVYFLEDTTALLLQRIPASR